MGLNSQNIECNECADGSQPSICSNGIICDCGICSVDSIDNGASECDDGDDCTIDTYHEVCQEVAIDNCETSCESWIIGIKLAHSLGDGTDVKVFSSCPIDEFSPGPPAEPTYLMTVTAYAHEPIEILGKDIFSALGCGRLYLTHDGEPGKHAEISTFCQDFPTPGSRIGPFEIIHAKPYSGGDLCIRDTSAGTETVCTNVCVNTYTCEKPNQDSSGEGYCASNEDCDDGNPCTRDICTSRHRPIHGPLHSGRSYGRHYYRSSSCKHILGPDCKCTDAQSCPNSNNWCLDVVCDTVCVPPEEAHLIDLDPLIPDDYEEESYAMGEGDDEDDDDDDDLLANFDPYDSKYDALKLNGQGGSGLKNHKDKKKDLYEEFRDILDELEMYDEIAGPMDPISMALDEEGYIHIEEDFGDDSVVDPEKLDEEDDEHALQVKSRCRSRCLTKPIDDSKQCHEVWKEIVQNRALKKAGGHGLHKKEHKAEPGCRYKNCRGECEKPDPVDCDDVACGTNIWVDCNGRRCGPGVENECGCHASPKTVVTKNCEGECAPDWYDCDDVACGEKTQDSCGSCKHPTNDSSYDYCEPPSKICAAEPTPIDSLISVVLDSFVLVDSPAANGGLVLDGKSSELEFGSTLQDRSLSAMSNSELDKEGASTLFFEISTANDIARIHGRVQNSKHRCTLELSWSGLPDLKATSQDPFTLGSGSGYLHCPSVSDTSLQTSSTMTLSSSFSLTSGWDLSGSFDLPSLSDARADFSFSVLCRENEATLAYSGGLEDKTDSNKDVTNSILFNLSPSAIAGLTFFAGTMLIVAAIKFSRSSQVKSHHPLATNNPNIGGRGRARAMSIKE